MSIQWKGVMPAVTTKFTADDKLDFNMFGVNVKAQLEAGVSGIILGGTLGEASTLLQDEKKELIQETINIVNGQVPVIMNIAEQTTRAAILAANEAEKNGAKGLMLLPPMRYNAASHETVTYFSEIAKSTSLPIMIYNNPIDYKIEVTLDMFEEILKFDNIQAVKESTRDISNVTRIINRFNGRLKILSGVDTLALESIFMGSDGWVSGLVDAFPAETVAIFKLAKAGRAEEALAIGKKLGDEVIVVGTSFGGALTLYLASQHPEIKAIVLYSPCIKIFDNNAELLDNHWGLAMAKLVTGSEVRDFPPHNPIHAKYWSTHYHINGVIALQNFLTNVMTPETFAKVKCPTFLGYYYKNEEEQDKVVSVPAMLKMYDELGVAVNQKQKVVFPNAGNHVIGSYVLSKDYQHVQQKTEQFLDKILK